MTKEQDWQKGINQLVVVSAEFPFTWKQKILDVAAQLNCQLTDAVIRANHPPDKVFSTCPECNNVSSLEISVVGCKCLSCSYTSGFPLLETDLENCCSNCGEATKISSEGTSRCITCNQELS